MLLYIDPGTGSLIWQLALAGLFGFLFYIRKIFNWFLFWRRRNDKNDGLTAEIPDQLTGAERVKVTQEKHATD